MIKLKNLLTDAKQPLTETGIRNINALTATRKKALIYFHMDLDGVTTAIGMKAYLEKYGVTLVKCEKIQYGGMEFAVQKPAPGLLVVIVDFAHGKPMVHIHTDHHQSQAGVAPTTSGAFKHAPSNVAAMSQEISPTDLFPAQDIQIISTVDSANFASQGINPDQVMRSVFEFDPTMSAVPNRLAMGLVVNKVLLAFKNKPGFLEALVMKARPSLVSIYNVIKQEVTARGLSWADLPAKTASYLASQAPDLKMKQITSPQEIQSLGNGQYAMFGTCLVQYGGGTMTKGGYDRYTPFKMNPTAEYLVIGWPMGLVQASKNPFKKGANPINLGELAMGILNKHKSELQAMQLTMGDVKRKMEMDIKKGSTDSVGFTMDDFMALFGEVAMNLPKSPGFQNTVKDIAGKQYQFLSSKQKAILNGITTTVYDVIVKGSGGHRDITNISGLNFIGSGRGPDYIPFLKQLMGELAEALASARLQ